MKKIQIRKFRFNILPSTTHEHRSDNEVLSIGVVSQNIAHKKPKDVLEMSYGGLETRKELVDY